jgi:hypothetical protein
MQHRFEQDLDNEVLEHRNRKPNRNTDTDGRTE